MKDNGQSIFEYNEISNSPTSSKTFNRSDVFNIQIINNTGLEVQVVSRETGEIRIPSNSQIEFKGHPLAPSRISYKIRFNIVAPTTDFIRIISTQLITVKK
tara:strand:- start:1743 stop:2045 length:303 start_codon:yes stop_codon:yes gene_type:complete